MRFKSVVNINTKDIASPEEFHFDLTKWVEEEVDMEWEVESIDFVVVDDNNE